MSSTRLRFLCPRSRSQSGQRSKLCFSNNSKTTEANLIKLLKKIEHNVKVWCAQELGSYDQRQGHNQVRGQNQVWVKTKLENVFVKHYAPNHMPDPKGEWSLKENNSELHYGICSKVYQFIYTLVCNYMPIMRILVKAVLQISRSKGCSYTKCLCPKKESNATEHLPNRFKSYSVHLHLGL